MKNLINFFFSFDKLMKEKLVIAFFWLALIIAGLNFFSEALSAIKLGPLAAIVEFVIFFGSILLTLVTLRLVCELAVALFRINDNLSPDGGKSETANIDPIVEARKAAEAAAMRARDLSKTAGEKASAATKGAVDKTKSATESVKDSAENAVETAASKTKEAASSLKISAKEKTAATTKTPAKPAATKTSTASKKRGRPAGSKNKTATAKKQASKTKTASTSAPKKRGPKPGSKAPRDAQGRLLKKDGTLRGKPGPKKNS